MTSYDVFLTTAGDVLIATGVPTRTPVPGEPGEFISHVDLTVVGALAIRIDAEQLGQRHNRWSTQVKARRARS